MEYTSSAFSGTQLSRQQEAEIKKRNERRKAKEKLEAAAPDLLDALKVAVLALTHEPINPDDIAFIKAAIKLAE